MRKSCGVDAEARPNEELVANDQGGNVVARERAATMDLQAGSGVLLVPFRVDDYFRVISLEKIANPHSGGPTNIGLLAAPSTVFESMYQG